MRAGCGRRWRAPTRIFGILPVHGNWDHEYQHERIGDLDSWGASDNMHAVRDMQRWTANLDRDIVEWQTEVGIFTCQQRSDKGVIFQDRRSLRATISGFSTSGQQTGQISNALDKLTCIT